MKTIAGFRPLMIALLLALATLLVFARTAGHEFLFYDDNMYVTENPIVQRGLSWSGVVWAFTTMHAGNWALTAVTWRKVGFWKTQEFLFRHVPSVTTDNWLAHDSLGDCLSRTGNVEEALFHIREALRLSPEEARAWYNLGVLQRKTGQYPGAVSALRESLRLKPRYANAWSNLGAVYQALDRVPEAGDALREAVRLAPDDAMAWYKLGSIYGNIGWYVEAIEAYREAVRIQPDFAAAWNNLGIIYAKAGRHAEAIEIVRKLRAIDRGRAEDLLHRINQSR